jgi:hypothetical protein
MVSAGGELRSRPADRYLQDPTVFTTWLDPTVGRMNHGSPLLAAAARQH